MGTSSSFLIFEVNYNQYVRGGREVVALARGQADREVGIPLDTNAQFRIASITKAFVAALLFQLVEEGCFGLDEPLVCWMPEQPFADRVTLRHVLTHTRGLPIYSLCDLDNFPPADADLARTAFNRPCLQTDPASVRCRRGRSVQADAFQTPEQRL
jgi:CubicO group peptidase (beta-lactamase class C family)